LLAPVTSARFPFSPKSIGILPRQRAHSGAAAHQISGTWEEQ
jgi:hypothetical protein